MASYNVNLMGAVGRHFGEIGAITAFVVDTLIGALSINELWYGFWLVRRRSY